MGLNQQLKLILWKDILVRRRNFGVTTLVFGWAIAVFLVLYSVRESVDLEYHPTCHYNARSLPSAGLFPFVQSFICNVDNKCNDINQYEEVPQYKNARLTAVAKQLQTVFTNDTILNIVNNFPNMIVLLKTIGSGLDSPDLREIFGSDIKIKNFFNDPQLLKRELLQESQKLDNEVIDTVLNSSLQLGYLFKSLGKTDLMSSVCDPDKLSKFLLLQNPQNINNISAELCNIPGDKISNIIQNIFNHADFSKLLKMIGETVDKFTNYDLFTDLQNIVAIFLNLNTIKDNTPKYLKLTEWLPQIIPLFKDLNTTGVDKNFVIKSLEIIEPFFKETTLYLNYKNLIMNITDIFLLFQTNVINNGPYLTEKYEIESPKNFEQLANQIETNIQKLNNPTLDDLSKRNKKLLEISTDVLHAIPAFNLNTEKPWILLANVLDNLKPIINNSVLNKLSSISVLFAEIVSILQNTLTHEFQSERIMYNLCEKHSTVVSTLFSLGPEFITNIFNCFGNISCTSIIVANRKNISKIFCDKSETEKILPNISSIKNIDILCDINLNDFINDLILEFNLDGVSETVEKYSNNNESEGFLNAVISTNNLLDFLQKNKRMEENNLDINWEHLFPDFENTEWSKIATDARKHTGLYMLNVQLCNFKETFKDKTELTKALNTSSKLIQGFIAQYKLIPKKLLEMSLQNLPKILENILITFTNKTKILMQSSLDKWEEYFCNLEKIFINRLTCVNIRYLNMINNQVWFEQPLTSSIYEVIKSKNDLSNLNWELFIFDAQNLYLTVQEILKISFSKFDWEKMEVFQPNFWINWIQNLDKDTQITFGIQIVSKIGDMLEKNYLDHDLEHKWTKITNLSSSINNFVIFILDLINFGSTNEVQKEIEKIYPKSYNLSQIILNDYDGLISDFKSMLTNHQDLIKLVNWLNKPCMSNNLELFPNSSTNNILLTIKNALCDDKAYFGEWQINNDSLRQRNQFTRTSKILHELNYLKWKNSKSNSDRDYDLSIIEQEITFEKVLFEMFDIFFERQIMRRDTLREMWIKLNSCRRSPGNDCSNMEMDTVKYSGKYAAAALKLFASNMNKYLNLLKETNGIDPLAIIGFTNNSIIYNIYKKFPDFVKVFVYSYRSSDFENNIFEKRSKNQTVKCSDVMKYLLIPENTSITINDINSLSRYLCPSVFDWPIMEDNLFLSTITKMQDLYLDTPVFKLNVTFVDAVKELLDLKNNIIDVHKQSNIRIKQLWDNVWTEKMKKLFYDMQQMKFTSNNSFSRYFKYMDIPKDILNISMYLINPKYGFGDFTILFREISNSLNNFVFSNISATNMTSQKIEDIQNFVDFYLKDIKKIYLFIILQSKGYEFWNYFDNYCLKYEENVGNDTVIPNWMKENRKIVTQLCQIKNDDIRSQLIPLKRLQILKYYNVNLEDEIISFLTTLNNFVNNDSTIKLSDFVTQNFNLTDIFNQNFPDDKDLIYQSSEEAERYSIDRWREAATLDEIMQLSSTLLSVLKGGDWWRSLLSSIEDPTIKIWLKIIERAPKIIIHLADAAISPHLLRDVTSRVVSHGATSLCDDNFDVSFYLKDGNLVTIVKDVCSEKNFDFEAVQVRLNNSVVDISYDKNKMTEHIYNFKRNLINLIQQGPKKFDLPKWMNESDILQSYKDYSVQNSKPLKLLQIVTVVLNELIDIGSVFYKNQTNECGWCNIATIIVKAANKQIGNSQDYTELLCQIPHLKHNELKDILLEKFQWKDFFKDFTGNKNYSIDEFDQEIHDIVNTVRIQLITFYTNQTLMDLPEKCMAEISNNPALKNITTYISMLKESLSLLKYSSTKLLSSELFNSSQNTEFTLNFIPILKPISSILSKDNNLINNLKLIGMNDTFISELLSLKLDVNTMNKIDNTDQMRKHFQDYGLFNKIFTFNDSYRVADFYHEMNTFNADKLSEIFFESIDKQEINNKITEWKKDSDNFWVDKIFDSLEKILINGGDILEFISTVDFSELSTGNINISGLLRGILDLLEHKSIERLFISLRELIKYMSPIIKNVVIENDLYTLLDGVENLTIFKKLGLLRITYKISDLFSDWRNAKNYFVETIEMDKSIIDDIFNASIDISEIISSQGDLGNFNQVICSSTNLSKILIFNSDNPERTAQEISEILCNISLTEFQNMAAVALTHINFANILDTVMKSTINSILSSANLTEDEGQSIVKSIGQGIELLPNLKTMISNISDNLQDAPNFQSLKSNVNESDSLVISSDLLSSASTLLCGRPLIQSSSKLYKIIAQTKDFNADNYDKMEYKSLPTDFCRNIYTDIKNMEIGKLIWSYIKPLLRGQILYTPKTPTVTTILQNANTTFASIAQLQEILFKITDSLMAVEDKESIGHFLDNIQEFLNSSVVQIAVQNVLKNYTTSKVSFNEINLKGMLESLGGSKSFSSALKFGSDFLKCVLLDRFVGVSTEEELEQKAKMLMKTNEFIAGIVFLNPERNKRSINISDNISYKIRMDIDSVPSTNTLKYKFWTPGPDSDFLDELRYFRGFIQLQDLIDNAIMKLKSNDLPNYVTLTQEMPYPCWTKDFFKSALSVSQTFQVCFFFGLIGFIASCVRYIIWEKESGNTMIMNVMGLKYSTNCLSWFIITFVEVCLIMIAIFIILLFGQIITLSNNVLLFSYLILFGFSVTMFCYMISSMFNSASLASVASAIFYLLSYMPYIIIISLETNLGFWAKMITNLSMSTTFCYGCLYLIRFEVQGVGLQWGNIFESPIIGDSMNFAYTCVFLLFDGFLYGLIGFLASQKHQGKNYLNDNVSSTNIIIDEPLKIGVTIKGLTKIYNKRKKLVQAIENIDITLYTGHVTTLLGHNGAGKTTLIKILTGMIQPTSGQIIINNEITDNESDKSKFLGICPQGSVLINTMTPLEHLIFYAKLKTSRTTLEVMPEVMEMIDALSLGYLSKEPVSHLSEGMKRRLCVAIAFIGKPKLVVLDEPTSGVDPIARRQIWDLIIRYKQGCTVLLTTHYLDEAEILSDRVVVLHKGKVLCCGTPLVLKQSYGNGYTISVDYAEKDKKENSIDDSRIEMLLNLIKKVAANATLNEVKQNSVDIVVPFNSSDGSYNNFEKAAAILEDNQSNLGFQSFNMNCATLEKIFLDLCERADAKENYFLKNPNRISQLGKSYIDPKTKSNEILLNSEDKLTGNNFEKFFALMKKRALHYLFDWRVVICAFVLPTLFTAVAMGFSLIRPPNSLEEPLNLTPDLYSLDTTSFISVDMLNIESFINNVSQEVVKLSPHKNLEMYQKTEKNCVCEDGMQKCEKSSYLTYDTLMKFSSAKETNNWIVNTQMDYIERRYGGWSFTDKFSNQSAMIVWYNNKGYHSMPSYLNTLNNAILKSVSPASSITTFNHPLKLSVDQLSKSTVAQHIADVGIAMVLLIAFSLIPASGSIYLVQERVNEEKILQFLCGVSPTLYWLVSFIWDLIILAISLLLAVIVFKIFGLPVYVAKDNMAAVSLLIFLYGWACIPFIHLCQRFFQDSSMANMILFCSCTFIGIAELTCLLLMDILGKTQFVADLRDVLHNIYLIFPPFVLGDGLVEISKNNIQSEILERFHMDTYISPLSWELMGVHYLSLFIIGIITFLINLIIENQWFIFGKKSTNKSTIEMFCLEVDNLTKTYKTVAGKHTAIDKISFKLPFGECLGLIGVNGAGKSTTFKVLTSELRPTSGTVYLNGKEITRKPIFSGEIGYCPQNDALDPKLTVSQTINLYLTLKGVNDKKTVLEELLHKFELTVYQNRKNENLSGGNKRKLCTALAVIGKTTLILMDEPTSGMDPYSRSLVGSSIQQLIKENKSIILTSHSVEDCESLCSKIIVMINGKIICQGSPQNLKEKYGSGYIISIRLAKPSDQNALYDQIIRHFPGSELISRQYCNSQYSIPMKNLKISEIFSKMQEISQLVSVEDFNLVQSSLDQVFINLANKSETSTCINIESKSLPNMYAMDIIH